jgi:hypothetical protein
MAEFVIVVVPFFVLLFGLMQLALASVARVLVTYAAFAAARAAIVILPQPAWVPDTPLRRGFVEAPGQIGHGRDAPNDFVASTKLAAVRDAAMFPLTASSPPADSLVRAAPELRDQLAAVSARMLVGARASYRPAIAGSLDAAAGGAPDGQLNVGRALESDARAPIERTLFKLLSAELLTGVAIRSESGAIKTRFAWNDRVKVRVVYLFACRIPLAAALCQRPTELALDDYDFDRAALAALPGRYLALRGEQVLTVQGRPGQ